MKTTAEIAAWRKENPRKRIDLYGADLSSADLSGADLRRADLYGADLSSADLSGADLRGADLYGADLSSADLSGADLSSADLRRAVLSGARGIYLLSIVDPRSYVPVITTRGGEPRIFAGCRSFTIEKALMHWGEGYQGERWIGDRYLAGLRQLDCDHFRKWVEDQKGA